ncbi:hypothetical protein [Thalassovita aquimarina]|uniref:hypothetical protein n=1 Tax=Thalassovita aquimarina TaxID=2785917 RepID=UPI003566847C
MKNVIAAVMLGTILSGPVLAGPVGEFKTTYRETYARYRAALFQTNTGQAEALAKAMTAFAGAWDAFAGRYGETPPPTFSEDPAWSDTMSAVSAAIRRAGEQVAAGELPAAHETLERVRDLLGEMHARNGIETFSDRMNAYHAAMEQVLVMDLSVLDADTLGLLRERAAVLSYLAGDLLARPPKDAAGNADYAKLSKAFEASVAAVLDAARAGDREAVRAAVAGLKKPYARLFVKFG